MNILYKLSWDWIFKQFDFFQKKFYSNFGGRKTLISTLRLNTISKSYDFCQQLQFLMKILYANFVVKAFYLLDLLDVGWVVIAVFQYFTLAFGSKVWTGFRPAFLSIIWLAFD